MAPSPRASNAAISKLFTAALPSLIASIGPRRPAIEAYIEAHNCEPGSCKPLLIDSLYPNVTLRDLIQQWLVEGGEDQTSFCGENDAASRSASDFGGSRFGSPGLGPHYHYQPFSHKAGEHGFSGLRPSTSGGSGGGGGHSSGGGVITPRTANGDLPASAHISGLLHPAHHLWQRCSSENALGALRHAASSGGGANNQAAAPLQRISGAGLSPGYPAFPPHSPSRPSAHPTVRVLGSKSEGGREAHASLKSRLVGGKDDQDSAVQHFITNDVYASGVSASPATPAALLGGAC